MALGLLSVVLDTRFAGSVIDPSAPTSATAGRGR